MRKAARWAAVVAALAVAAACSGGGSSSAGDTTAPSSTSGASSSASSGATVTSAGTTGATPTTGKKVRVGTVIGTVPEGGTVNQVETNDGDPLAAQDLIGTKPAGKVDFSVGNALPSCSLDGDSAVQIQPADNVVLSIRQGVVTCRTSTANSKNFVAGQTVITAIDPVVLIGYDGQQATVRVAQGYVGVRAGSAVTLVGARQQASAGGGSGVQVGPWDPAELAPDDNAFVSKEVGTAVGQARAPAYPTLSAQGSPVLARATQRGAFLVDVVGGDDQATAVATALLSEFLRHGTSLEVKAQAASAADATAALQNGEVDAAVATNGQGNPLFTVDDRTWRLVTPRDQGSLVGSLQAFVAAALQARCSTGRTAAAAQPGQSCYETLYRQAVHAGAGSYVPLDGLAGYLGLR